MNIPTKTLVAAGRYLLNKAAAIALLLGLMHWYHALPSGEDAATPYAELIYTAILIVGVAVVFPLIRLLIFPEAATFAESGQLKTELQYPSYVLEGDRTVKIRFSPALVHYWIATGISFLLTVAIAATLTH